MILSIKINRYITYHSRPVSIDEREIDGKISFYWDGDCHEDAGREEDVSKGVEEVREEMIVRLETEDNQPMVGVAKKFVEDFHVGLYETEEQEDEVWHCQGYQQVVEVAFKWLLTEDQNGANISNSSKHWENGTEVSTYNVKVDYREELLTLFYLVLYLAFLTKVQRKCPQMFSPFSEVQLSRAIGRIN